MLAGTGLYRRYMEHQRRVHTLALSYAGELSVTVVADPDQVPDLPVPSHALQAELDASTR